MYKDYVAEKPLTGEMKFFLSLSTLLVLSLVTESKLTEEDDGRVEDIVASYMSKLKQDSSKCSLKEFYDSGQCHTCEHFCLIPSSKDCQAICPFYAVYELAKADAKRSLHGEISKLGLWMEERRQRDLMIIYGLIGVIILLLLGITGFIVVKRYRKTDQRVKEMKGVEEGCNMDSKDTLLSDITVTGLIRRAADDTSTNTSPSHHV